TSLTSASGDAIEPRLAQQRQRLVEWQADHVRLAALDALDEAAALALGRVRAGLVERLAGRHVAADLAGRRRAHLDVALDERAPARERRALDQRDGSQHAVRAADEATEQALGVGRVGGLAEHVA